MIRPTASGRSAIVILSARSTTDAQIVRPYRASSRRAFLQRVTRFAVLQQSHRLQHRVLVVVERLGDVEGSVL